MFLEEIIKYLERDICPKKYRTNDRIYGLHYGGRQNRKYFRKIMITLTLSKEAIRFARDNKIYLIISRYGLMGNPIRKLDYVLSKKTAILTKNHIIYVLGSAFINSIYGVSNKILRLLNLKTLETNGILFVKNKRNEKIPLGRFAYPMEYTQRECEIHLRDLLIRARQNFGEEQVLSAGYNLNQVIEKILVMGMESPQRKVVEKAFNFQRFDLLISGKITLDIINFLIDRNVSVIDIPIYRVEYEALRDLNNFLSLEYPNDEFLFYEPKDLFIK